MSSNKQIRVLKFGGSSLADADAIRQVSRVIQREGDRLLVVVSAIGGVTDLLIEAAQSAASEGRSADLHGAVEKFRDIHEKIVKELVTDANVRTELMSIIETYSVEFSTLCFSIATLKELTSAVTARTVARGERLMAQILAHVLKSESKSADWVDATDLIYLTRDQVGLSPSLELSSEACNEKLKPLFDEGINIVVVPGFIGSGPDLQVRTLGRGGSDYTATILANCTNAESVTLYKEVNGLMTADPAWVSDARVVPELHYREAAELAFYGTRLLHPRTIIPLVDNEIPLVIKNTFNPDAPGTRIASDVLPGAYPVKALTAIRSQTLISVEGKGMAGIPGIAGRTFSALAREGISVSMISQASSESSICFVIAEEDSRQAQEVLALEFQYEIERKRVDSIKVDGNVSVIALVGLGMSGTKGIAARAFSCLAKENFNIMAIAQGSSELNISIVLADDHVPKSLQALHREYRLQKIRALPHRLGSEVNIAIFGFGQIGRTLSQQIEAQSSYFWEKMKLKCHIVGLADSSGLLIEEKGFTPEVVEDLTDLKKQGGKLTSGKALSVSDFGQHLSKNLWNRAFQNGIFVDLTAEDTAPLVHEALQQGMHVVLANKKPLAIPLNEFKEMLALADHKGLSLRYEATVGAGLPILDTIAKLESAGDEVLRILGCLSGTLGYLMTAVDDGEKFSSAVLKAWKLGYTEPDPREDLSGLDVARKALILARTLGKVIELGDIALEPLFPEELSDDDPKAFCENLKKLDDVFAQRIATAKAKKKVLRYVARIEQDQVSVGIEEVDADSPLGRLRGTDNQVSIQTRMYDDNPLIVTGPGAGADVTAAGVLNDILAIASMTEGLGV